jgi:hypothetical protein
MVVYFSKNTVALGVMDFWAGSALMVALALFEVLLFGWVFGAERGLAEANRGSDLRIPRLFVPVIRYVCPAYLVAILGGFVYQNLGDQIRSITGTPAALLTASFMIAVLIFLGLMVHLATARWEREGRFAPARRVAKR